MAERSDYNRFSRLIVLSMLVVALFTCLFVATACKKHQHDYTSAVTKQPTCTETGVETFTCKCGDSYTQPISALGHSFTSIAHDDKAHWSVCSRCGTANPDEKSTAHSYTILDEDAGVAPTCTEQGKVVHRCVCGADLVETLPASGHELSYVYEGNEHWQECANCDYTTEKTAHSLAFHSSPEKHWQECANCDYATAEAAHKYASKVTREPTCTVKGETTYFCECEHSYTESINTIAHDYTEIVTTSANHWTVCSMCKSEDPDHPKTAHTWEITGVKQEAPCTDNGYDFVKCTVCDYESTQMSNSLGHDFENAVLGDYNSNGHRMQCSRCDEFVFIRHDTMDAELIGEDVDCPNGHNKAATCGANGHQDKACLICGEAFHTVVPATGNHRPSEWVTTHGTEHWRLCEVCDAELERAFHTKEWQVISEATCTENGRESQVCTICGHVDAGGRSIDKLGHSYEPTGVILLEPTCFDKGSEEIKCATCGNISSQTIEKLGHDWSPYQSDATGHWRTCNRCQLEDKGNHSYGKGTVIQQASTCGETTITRYTCSFDKCGYNDDRETVKQHVYSQVEESYVEGNCSNYTEYDERCANCGDVKHVVVEEYGAHNPVFHPKKDRTDTEDGNIAYWQCTICERYFTSKTCVNELTADEIFDYAPKYIVLENIDQLIDAVLGLEENEPSYDIYEITLEVSGKTGYTLELIDSVQDSIEIYIALTDITNIGKGDIVTIKGHLIFDDYDSYFYDAEIISVIGSDSELFSMYLYVNDTTLGKVVAESETGEIFYPNYGAPLSLMLGETVTFTCYGYNGAVLKSVIINGEACSTNENGQIIIEEVSCDITAQFVFDTTNIMDVVLYNLNTSVSGASYEVTPYLSYTYDGGANDYGRLYQGSATEFVLNKANLISVVIEFENYNLDQVIKNTIYAGTDKIHKNSIGSYELNSKTNKTTLEFNSASAMRYFEYSADVGQARIASIRLIYVTNNVLANG